jgi:O-succinylbenzoate synthase
MFQYSKYKIPLSNFENSKTEYNFQEIILIKSNKSKRLLEISPLENFSKDNIIEIERLLNSQKDSFKDNFPSFEFSLSDIEYEKESSIRTSILISKNENIRNKIFNFLKLGFKSFKIKLSKDDYIRKVEELKSIDSNLSVRADFNNEFSIEESKNLVNNIDFGFEFIEGLLKTESFENYMILKKYKQKLCIDINQENIKDINKIIAHKLISYIAIKPKLLGNTKNSIALAKNCFNNNINSYVSSTFETQIGFNKSIYIAKILDELYGKEIVHGFGTYNYIEKSLLEGITLDKGYIKSRFSKFDLQKIIKYQISDWQEIFNLNILEKLNHVY